MGLVLASSSPRRRRLLEEAGIPHRVLAPSVDESTSPDLAPRDAVLRLARRKAFAALPDAGGDRVLAADTVVELDGEILGKPADPEDAVRILSRLSGRRHEVHTGLCLLNPRTGREIVRVVTSVVRFRDLDAEEIAEYVRTGEPLDKAGAYGIQGGAAGFVAALEGSRDNVIGLPVDEVRGMLAEAT